MSNFYLDMIEDARGDLVDIDYYHRSCASDELRARGDHPCPEWPDYSVYCEGCGELIHGESTTWTSGDGLAQLWVAYIGVDHDSDDRPRYEYQFFLDRKLIHSGDDIRGGSHARYDLDDALQALASFLGAWEEAISYGVPTYGSSENADLFPDSMTEWADRYADELWIDTHLEEEE